MFAVLAQQVIANEKLYKSTSTIENYLTALRSFTAFAGDSLQMQGLVLDTTKYEDRYVLADTLARNFAVAIYHQHDTITDILENYTASYNDSTTNLWQAKHDELQKEFGWPNMGKHGDLHKEATFENKKGTVLLILLNTYSPTMSVRDSTSTTQK